MSPDSPVPARLVLVRHGETVGNRENLWTGWSETPLTDLGRRQAESAASRLRSEPWEITALYSSPLGRAWHTALTIGQALGLWPMPSDALREMHFGELENINSKRFPEEYPAVYAQWSQRTDESFGWPGGETRWAFRQRVAQALTELAAAHPGNTILLVTHSGVIRMALAHFVPQDFGEWWRVKAENCSLTHLLLNGRGRATVPVFNDFNHLTLQ